MSEYWDYSIYNHHSHYFNAAYVHFQTRVYVKHKSYSLRSKHSNKNTVHDQETQLKLQEETKKLYTENNVSPYIGCLPLLVQMPVMMALYRQFYEF